MQGKKTDNETIYKVMVSYVYTNNASETARQLDMSSTTVDKIIKDNRNKEEFKKLWEEKKEEFDTLDT
jgi:ActR/RegA family two-component response regulator